MFALSSESFISLMISPKFLPPSCNTTSDKPGQLRCPTFRAALPSTNDLQFKERRSANYHPTIWDLDYIGALTTVYNYEYHGNRLEELKQKAKQLLVSTTDHGAKLEIIDHMQRLGVAYHFEEEIRDAINAIGQHDGWDLYATSLYFRLILGQTIPISSDVFQKFRSGDGKFMGSLREDIRGLLALYEASHLGLHGDDAILEEAKSFTTKHLKSIQSGSEGDILAKQVQQSLEIPLHLRMPRAEARCFIGLYEKDESRSSLLLELAKLDYNLVQSQYQKELKHLARWWKDLGLAEKLKFSRDRLMENFLWAMGICYEPQFSKCRVGLTKFVCILTAIDDMYDVYGSLEELELFTKAVNRWDPKAVEDIPEYMRICYLAMLNFANELAYNVLKEYGHNIIPYLVEAWTGLCESYMVEARWFYGKNTPNLEEYLHNSWISVGGPAAMIHGYVLLGCTTKEQSIDSFKCGYSDLLYWSSLITRLNDDLGTSTAESKRGDVAKFIECYSKKEGVSEAEAREHTKGLISHCWKQLNKEITKPSIPRPLVKLCLNMARSAHFIFQHGDGIGTSTSSTKDWLRSLVIDPFPIKGEEETLI